MAHDITMPIAFDDIDIGDRRDVDPGTVRRLAESIDKIGLRHPVTVIRRGERYRLVAGRHRLEACRKLGREHVMATIVSMTNADARLWEIAENLHRAELTKLERAEQIDEWRRLTADKVSQVATPNSQPNEAGVRKTAEALGITKEEVTRASQIAGITPEARDAAHEAGPAVADSQAALLKIAEQPPERQVATVHELKNRQGPVNVKTWRDDFQRLWARGTEDDHRWAREYIDAPVMGERFA